MFEDLNNMNRKRFRWRKWFYFKCGEWTRVKFLYVACFLLLCGTPKVAATSFTFNVTENSPIGTEVGAVSNGGSSLHIVDKSEGVDDAFDSDLLRTGRVVTISELNRENIDQYKISLFRLIPSQLIFEVTVNVLDVNDNSPTFANENTAIEVSELSQVGSEFNLGSALDEDAPPFNVQGYRLVGANSYFGVNTKVVENGTRRLAELVVLQQLDRETIPYHTVIVEAYDGGNPTPNTGRLTVNVSVSDSNDNSPVFEYLLYNATISEGDSPGTDIITVKATDRDAGVNGDVVYSIDRTMSDPDELFRINSATGSIYINKQLDSETATEHRLTVLATDGGAQPQVGATVVIIQIGDVNDNPPSINIIFLGSNEGKVSEGAAIGDYIARISVTDPDVGDVGKFNVTMLGGDERFGLRTENNVVYLIRVKEQLDREEKSSYDIVLNATDFGSPPMSSTASFTIEVEDINDNPPVFERDSYQANISEESVLGEFVFHLSATDLDLGENKKFEYILQPSAQSDWFHLNSQSGLVTTAKLLDHEVNPEVRLTITAMDRGVPRLSSSTTLVVTIGNANDSTPRFERRYTGSVLEDVDVGHCILQVKAVDPDHPDLADQIEYTFAEAENQPAELSLNRSDGRICVVKSLDRETTASYRFRVKATDKAGQHSFSQITIEVSDVNDNRPAFHPTTYLANIPAGTSTVGYPVTRVTATDADDASENGSGFGIITYEILNGNELNLFAFDNKTGEITIARPLASFGDTLVRLRIRAVDGGKKSTDDDATVTISIINTTIASIGGPVFEHLQYSWSIAENAPQGKVIGTISASVKGDAKVLYNIRNDPPKTDWFAIDIENGTISVGSSLDREIFSSVQLQVIASSGNPPLYGFGDITITIDDVNDNAPVFLVHPQSVSELPSGTLGIVTIPTSLPVLSEIQTVQATDADEGQNALIHYRLRSDAGYFAIDTNSGVITLTRSLPTETRNFSIVVEASDGAVPPMSTTGTIFVQSLRADGDCPTFSSAHYSISIPEDTELSTGIYDVLVTSSSKVTYRIIPNADTYSFAIFPNGTLYLTAKLDYELKTNHRFQLAAESAQATIFSNPCTTVATIDVTVSDVNDNLPYFDPESTVFNVKENVPTGTIIGLVIAADADSGKNAELKYSMPIKNEYFDINNNTGVISTIGTLDREAMHSHAFLVQVRDSSDAPWMSQTTVRIFVEDENDSKPRFLYNFHPVLSVVQKRTSPDNFVAILQAVDNDIGKNGDVTYSITSGGDLFEINAKSGRVSHKNNVKVATTYSLTVEAKDNGNISRSSSMNLQVRVNDKSSNPAQFSENKYAFFVPGNFQPGGTLGRFMNTTTANRAKRAVGDEDILLTSFYISEGNENDDFYVDGLSGELILLRKLNYEDAPQFMLKVTAENSLDSSDIRTFEAQINLEDANDYSPVFSSASFLLKVREESPINTKIWKFSAIDNDIAQNGEISYSIVSQTANTALPLSSSSSEPFRIDPTTGDLFTNLVIDREQVPEYILIIKATDGSITSPKSATVSAVVTVQDVNDNRPVFMSRNTLHVSEDEPVGFPVMCLAAEDRDLGANAHVTYGITQQQSDSGNSIDNFQINPSTGLISLIRRLDFETATTHRLTVSAIDSAALDPLTTSQDIVIHVIDVNDEAPKFSQNTYFVEVFEDAVMGSLVTKVVAEDGDSGKNGEVTYEMHDPTASFEIDGKSGVIVTKKALDRESVDSYTLTVYAHDGAFPSLYTWCTVEVSIGDVNDNDPKFAFDSTMRMSSSKRLLGSIKVHEYIHDPTHIYTALATDLDSGDNGNITFSIAGGNAGDSFTINPYSGEVWTAGHLDRETVASYRLKLVVTDNGAIKRSSEAYLDIAVLDSNDNDPKFNKPSYVAEISEGMPAGQFVLTVHADDEDEGLNSVVTYSIDPGMQQNSMSGTQPEGLFAIHPETGAITTTAVLDREKKSSHQFIVQANDSAPYNPRKALVTVTINVLDVNDNRPIFDETLVVKNVSQTLPKGSDIATVSAQDKDTGENATIIYRISGGSSEPFLGSWINKFEIDSNGLIKTTQSLSGAYAYHLNISASDSGSPSLSSNAIVTINIVPFSAPGVSRIEFLKGTYAVDLSEGAEKNDRVTQVQAGVVGDGTVVTDKSSVTITYAFHSGNDEAIFAISTHGVITVKNPEKLDFETLPHLTLVVVATGVSSSVGDTMYAYATVSVSLTDENDNAPRFAQDRYVTATWEEQDPGMYVLQVMAHDIDAGQNREVRYYLDSGNTDNSFSIDSTTGLVSTDLTLDREIHEEYKLTVYAYDLGTPRLSSTCTLKVTVVDVNDHEPTLYVPSSGSVTVSEKLEIGNLITVVTANDPDTGDINFQFSQSKNNQNDFFTINSEDGKIHLAKSLDYEAMHQATIVVQATDGEHVDEKNIILNIEDFNDNAPIFDKQAYQATLDELSAINKSVIRIHAQDADSGANADITYTLIDIIPSRPAFFIDQVTGVIYTNSSESYNPQSSIYNLIVLATDHGTPSLNSTVPVRIEIQDINNHKPVFSAGSYTAVVSEAADRNTHVVNVTATDADFSDENRDVYYEITSGNQNGVFKINTLTTLDGESTIGEIRVAGDLDRETVPYYSLTVTAFDRGFPRTSSSANVTVNVQDVNDNQPVFSNSSYTASIPEDASGQPVVTVFAHDPDSSSSLMFKIIAGNYHSAFEIKECNPPSDGCALISAINLDYEEKSSYNLTVQVWDGRDTGSSKSSVVPVKISVLDVNEFSPYFPSNFGYKRVSEITEENQTVFLIPGQDRDGGIYGEIQYTIIDDRSKNSSGKSCLPAEEMFYIVPTTGEVKNKLPLDFEKCHLYSFSVKAENLQPPSNRRSSRNLIKPSYFPVKIEIESVDEYPPVFTTGNGKPIKLHVPYSAPVGYVVGQVNATDADSGRDGEITYGMDEDQEFVIDPVTGVITLQKNLNSHNSRVLTVTASSGGQSARTLVSIEIEGAPVIAVEAQVLAIVFGVIAVIAVIIVLILCWKHRKNKKANRPPTEAAPTIPRSEPEFHNPMQNGVPAAAPRLTNGKMKSKANSENQNHKPDTGHRQMGNGIHHSNGHAHFVGNGNHAKPNSGTKISVTTNGYPGKHIPVLHNGHAVIRNSLSSGRGSEQDDDIDVDREVDLINSSSDATNNNSCSPNSKPKIRKKISGQGRHRKQVPDSGIQKDIDAGSDISDGPNNIKSPSVESIHIFGDQGAGEEPLSIREIAEELEDDMDSELDHGEILSNITPHTESLNLKSELGSRYKSPLGTESNVSKATSNSKRGSDGADSGYSRRGRLGNWAPEFQPLADVFSEIARLKDRENAVKSGNHNAFVMKDLSKPPAFDVNDPPPLITSVAEQRSDLVAPVAIGFGQNRMQPRRSVGNNLAGIHSNPHPQYLRNCSHPPPSSYLPTMYSNAPKTPNLQRSHIGYNSNSIPLRPQAPFTIPHGNYGHGPSSINSSQQGLSVSSLPRTPISHESSFTSPALSANLSPSLTPLGTRSPSVSTVGDGGINQSVYDSDEGGGGIPLSKSDPNLINSSTDYTDGKNERAIRV